MHISSLIPWESRLRNLSEIDERGIFECQSFSAVIWFLVLFTVLYAFCHRRLIIFYVYLLPLTSFPVQIHVPSHTDFLCTVLPFLSTTAFGFPHNPHDALLFLAQPPKVTQTNTKPFHPPVTPDSPPAPAFKTTVMQCTREKRVLHALIRPHPSCTGWAVKICLDPAPSYEDDTPEWRVWCLDPLRYDDHWTKGRGEGGLITYCCVCRLMFVFAETACITVRRGMQVTFPCSQWAFLFRKHVVGFLFSCMF